MPLPTASLTLSLSLTINVGRVGWLGGLSLREKKDSTIDGQGGSQKGDLLELIQTASHVGAASESQVEVDDEEEEDGEGLDDLTEGGKEDGDEDHGHLPEHYD